MTQIDEPRTRRGWDFTLNTWPVRLIYALILGTIATVTADSQGLGTAVALGFFAVTTVIVWAVRSMRRG